MKPIPINEPLSVTLRVGEWLWLCGVLVSILNTGENEILDKFYNQVMEATD